MRRSSYPQRWRHRACCPNQQSLASLLLSKRRRAWFKKENALMYSRTIFLRGLVEMATAAHHVTYRDMVRHCFCSRVVLMNNGVEVVLAGNGLRSACGYGTRLVISKRGDWSLLALPTSSWAAWLGQMVAVAATRCHARAPMLWGCAAAPCSSTAIATVRGTYMPHRSAHVKRYRCHA
jgi:hypothetical protein